MDRAALLALAHEMGATPDRLDAVQKAPTFEEAQSRLTDLKAEVKKGFRRLALKYHPDRNPNDPTAETKFKALTPILKEVEALKLERRAPMRVAQVVFHHPPVPTGGPTVPGPGWYSSAYTSANSTTSTTSTGGYDARRVVFIRIS